LETDCYYQKVEREEKGSVLYVCLRSFIDGDLYVILFSLKKKSFSERDSKDFNCMFLPKTVFIYLFFVDINVGREFNDLCSWLGT
jgi:hypothetical protein